MQQRLDAKILWSGSIEWREGAAQHVIATAKGPGALEGQHVHRLLDHAQQRAVALWVVADQAGIAVAEVAAYTAEAHLLLDHANRLGETQRFILGHLEQVHGQALGALLTDGGKLLQLFDEELEVFGAVHERGRVRLRTAS